jgi:hypothetical protein
MQKLDQASVDATTGVMTDAEAQEVLRLHLKRSEGAPQLSTAEVAEAIRLPEEEVRNLLGEVRRNKKAEELLKPTPTVRKRKSRDVLIAVVAALIFIYAAVVGVSVGLRVMRRNMERDIRSVITTEGTIAPEAPNPYSPGYQVTFGSQEFFVSSSINPVNADTNPDLIKVLNTDINGEGSTASYPARQDKDMLIALRSGNWHYQNLLYEDFKITYRSEELEVSSTMPTYAGKQPEIRRLVEAERLRRVKGALDLLASKYRLRHPQAAAPVISTK